jgi:hypothetical protein
MKSKISAEILADSINGMTGDRLTTFRVRLPKWLIAELNTHRALSRNFASSRAIPAKKIREQVMSDPFTPVHWGANQKGMQAKQELKGWRLAAAKQIWLLSRWLIPPVVAHWLLEKVGLHKQVANRLLEAWMWADGVISATEWKNFFLLRNDPDAQPEFQELAGQMHWGRTVSNPRPLNSGEWHLPMLEAGSFDDIMTLDYAKRVSAARCARVSYLLREGEKHLVAEDLKLCDRLFGSSPRHLSPAEHQAKALPSSERCGNFVGWKQFRKEFGDEAGGDYGTGETVTELKA